MNDYNELYLYNIGYHVTETFKIKIEHIYKSKIDNKGLCFKIVADFFDEKS